MDEPKRAVILEEVARQAAEPIDRALELLEDGQALLERVSLERAAVPEHEIDGWLTRYAAFAEDTEPKN